jgi:3-deoxy-D-arabino-heptulosonate 7-phosphate (DAHP) synthase class II
MRPMGALVPPDGMMSQRLLTLLDPYRSLVIKNEDLASKLVGLAVIAWNLSFVPDEEHAESYAALTEEIEDDPVATEGMHGVLKDLIERKRLLYPDDERAVLHHEVEMDGDELRIRTASGPLHLAGQELE